MFRVQGMGSTIRKHKLGSDVKKRWVLRLETFEREKAEYKMAKISNNYAKNLKKNMGTSQEL
jgi:hypothetical protein